MKANAEGQGDGDVNVGDFILSSTRTTKKHVGCCSFTANEKSKCMLNNFNIQMCGMYVEFNQYIFNIFVGKKIHWNYVPKKNQNVIHLHAEEGSKCFGIQTYGISTLNYQSLVRKSVIFVI